MNKLKTINVKMDGTVDREVTEFYKLAYNLYV